MIWERRLVSSFAGAALGLAAGLASCDARAQALLATPGQSARPWTLGQCDRLTGQPARAVFNATVWSSQGWPVWRVVCVYPATGQP